MELINDEYAEDDDWISEIDETDFTQMIIRLNKDDIEMYVGFMLVPSMKPKYKITYP